MTSECLVVIAPAALGQLREIVGYIRDELCMPRAAERIFDEISDAVQGLRKMPKRFHVVDVDPLRSEGVRRMNVRAYSVFYVVNDGKRGVGVFAILHGTPSDERLKRIFSRIIDLVCGEFCSLSSSSSEIEPRIIGEPSSRARASAISQ